MTALRLRKEYLVFEDEGRGFEIKANEIKGHQAILRFLDRHLKGEESGLHSSK